MPTFENGQHFMTPDELARITGNDPAFEHAEQVYIGTTLYVIRDRPQGYTLAAPTGPVMAKMPPELARIVATQIEYEQALDPLSPPYRLAPEERHRRRDAAAAVLAKYPPGSFRDLGVDDAVFTFDASDPDWTDPAMDWMNPGHRIITPSDVEKAFLNEPTGHWLTGQPLD